MKKQIIVGIVVGLLIASTAQAVTVLFPTQGGTGIGAYTAGDIIYSDATNSLAALAVGSNFDVLHLASGVPAWTSTLGSSGTPLTKGWFTDLNVAGVFDLGGTVGTGGLNMLDDSLLTWGTGNDIASLNRSTTLTANTALASVFVGTPNVPALAANTLIISNTTTDGDIVFAVSSGGNSQGHLWIDGSANKLIFPDGLGAYFGDGADSRLYYDGTDTFWDLRVAGSGDLMIALAGSFPSPDPGVIHIWEGSAGAGATANTTTQLAIEHSDDAGISIITPSGKSGRILFGDESASNSGQIRYSHTADTLDFFTATGQRIAISAASFAFQEATTISTTTGDLTLSAAAGADVLIGDDATILYVDGGTGTIGLGAAASSQAMVQVGGTITPSSGVDVYGLFVNPTVRANGANSDPYLVYISGTIDPDDSVAAPLAASIYVDQPTFSAGTAPTVSASIYIKDAPGTGTTQYALWVDAGDTRLDGDLVIGTTAATAGVQLHLAANTPVIRISDSNAASDTATTGRVQFFRGDNTTQVAEIGKNSAATDDFRVGTTYTGGIVQLIGGNSVNVFESIGTSSVFNEDSGDIDFRVESDGATNAFVVDAGNESVGIFNDTEANTLLIVGGSTNEVKDWGSVSPRGFKVEIFGEETTSATANIMSGGMFIPKITASHNQNATATVGMRALNVQPFSINESSSGTLTGGAGLYIQDGRTGGMTVTNQYGIYIEALTVGSSDYGLYIAGADTYALWVDAGTSRFDGDLDLNTAGANITVGAANPKKTVVLSAAGGAALTTAGTSDPTKVEAATNDINYWVLDFDTTTEEHAFWNFVMPDSYDGGTFTAQFTWTNAGGSAAQTVDWGIACGAYADNDAIDAALGSEVTTTDTFLAQGDIHISDTSSAITAAGSPAGGQWMVCTVARKTASDDLAGDARLMTVKLEYSTQDYSD